MNNLSKEYSASYFLTPGECDSQQRMPITVLVDRIIEVATLHANTWNVLLNNVDVGDVCSIVENPQDGKVYIIGTTSTMILTFNSSNILLPTYSPATGLYAYIRAKY